VGKKIRTPDLKETTEFIDTLQLDQQDEEDFIAGLRDEIRSGRFGAEDAFSETGRRVRRAKGCE
jgi:hypothetical protein